MIFGKLRWNDLPGLCRTWFIPSACAAVLAACSETSINEAPVVDLSTRAVPPMQTIRGLPADGGARRDAGAGWYTVQKGDTLFRIAATFHCSVADLARWNGLAETAMIGVGQQLRVAAPEAPAPGPQTAVPAAAPADAAATPAEVNAIALPAAAAVESRPLAAVELPPAPTAPAPAPVEVAGSTTAAMVGAGAAPTAEAAPEISKPSVAVPWLWPVAGKVSSNFDSERSKKIEIAVADNAEVAAVADAEVSYTGTPRDYGNLVILRHPDGLLSVYAHLKSIGVKQGQTVNRGQIIGTAGKVGSGPPILHFEVRRKGVAVNPMDLLPPR